LPYKINESLKNRKIIYKDWNDKQLNLMINNYINIENNMLEIKYNKLPFIIIIIFTNL